MSARHVHLFDCDRCIKTAEMPAPPAYTADAAAPPRDWLTLIYWSEESAAHSTRHLCASCTADLAKWITDGAF